MVAAGDFEFGGSADGRVAKGGLEEFEFGVGGVGGVIVLGGRFAGEEEVLLFGAAGFEVFEPGRDKGDRVLCGE